ncbi:hypothetical protein FRC19_001898 [Serendipita sp. 401]|nr:hypothetical protein FRC19_001898 [Serendipita sp. 401]KAG9056031.1 hypothetical protein FS842_000475 [Serendipita sp. 407]
MVLRIGYIREHFASPLLQFAADDGGKTFTLVECPGGTGQVISAFKANEIDIGVALTDALLAGIANGNQDYKMIGQYVATPLNWAVTVGKDSKYTKLEELRGTVMGISRIGSGSQTMAAVMAMQQGWYSDVEKKHVEIPKVQVNNNIDGLIRSVNDGSTSAFMWEWFTTKPFVDQGLARFIGSVPTLWPCFALAGHVERTPPVEVREFLSSLSVYVRRFAAGLQQSGPFNVGGSATMSTTTTGEESPSVPMVSDEEKANVKYIMETFGYEEGDVREWLGTVGYPDDVAVLDLQVVVKTLDIMTQAGVVKPKEGGYDPMMFLNGEVARFANSD